MPIAMNSTKRLHWIVACFVFGLLIYTNHHTIIHYPNDFILDSKGDAIKNYFGPVWHVQHDSSYSRLEAMNYPQGEQVTFVDAQPYLSNALKFVDRHVYPVGDRVIGIMHVLLLLSVFLGMVCVFRILRLYGVEAVIAIAVAAAILLMHPLWLRFKGHYALAYMHVLPLAWLLLELFVRQERWRWLALLGVHVFVVTGIHLYHFAILSLFIGVYLVTFTLLKWRGCTNAYKLKLLLGMLLVIAVPAIAMQGWIALTDDAAFRPQTPYGLYAYRSNLISLFFPVPLESYFNFSWLDWPDEFQFEGIGYVGLSTYLLSLAGGVYLFRQLAVVNFRLWGLETKDKLLLTLVVAIFASAVMGMAIPFRALPDALYQQLGVLKQFRSLGRFVWIYHLLLSGLAWVVGYRMLWRNAGSNRRWLFSLLLFGFVLESFMFQRILYLNLQPNPFKAGSEARAQFDLPAVDFARYQAILTAPVQLHGTERGAFKTSTPELGHLHQKLYALQMQTGLPSVAIESARVPLEAGVEKMSLALIPLQSKLPAFFETLPNDKPLLLMTMPGTKRLPQHAWLYELGDSIATTGDVVLRSVSAQDWLSAHRALMNNAIARYDTLKKRAAYSGQFYAQDSSLLRYPRLYTSFETETTAPTTDTAAYFGQRAAEIVDNSWQEVLSFDLSGIDRPVPYRARVWMHFTLHKLAQHPLKIDLVLQKADGSETFELMKIIEQVHGRDGNWLLLDHSFELTPEHRTLKVFVDAKHSPVVFDDLMIMPKGVHHLTKVNGQRVLDNVRLLPQMQVE